MKTILLILSAIFLPLLLFLGWDHKLSQIPTSYSVKKSWAETSKNKIERVVTGTSREFDGINPAFLAVPTMNLANNAQDIYYDMKMARWSAEHFPNLKTVVYSIFPNTLIRSINDDARTTLYYRVYGFRPQKSGLLDFMRFPFTRVYTPSQGITGAVRGLDINLTFSIEPSGWTNHRQLKQRLNPSAEKELGELHSMQLLDPKYQEIIRSNIATLHENIDALRKKNLQVIIITVPTLPAYHLHLKEDAMRRFYGEIELLSKNYSVPYLNFLGDNRFVEEDFVDGSHLNIRGAKKFSLILNKELPPLSQK